VEEERGKSGEGKKDKEEKGRIGKDGSSQGIVA